MGIPVVIAENGIGVPIKSVEEGDLNYNRVPVMTVAENGFGLPIVLSDLGAPARVEGGGGLWTFANIPSEYKTNGGWWEPSDTDSIVLNGSKIVSIADQFGVRDMAQSNDALRPTLTSGAMVWPSVTNDVALGPASGWSPAYWLMVIQYKDGLDTTFDGMNCFIGVGGSGAEARRVMGSLGTAALQTTTVWDGTAEINAGAPTSTVLPLPLAMVEFTGTPTSGPWSIGLGTGNPNRSWQGSIKTVLALGTAPTGDLLDKIQGYAAWLNGLQASLPVDHPYRDAPPTTGSLSSFEIGGASYEAATFEGQRVSTLIGSSDPIFLRAA